MRELCVSYHDKAASNGIRIIPFCGFDSVPSDLGTYLVVRHIQQELGLSCLAVKAYFQLNGGFNGGTLASGFNLYDSGKVDQLGNPFLLNPSSDSLPIKMERNQDPKFPQYDPDIGTWVAPFFMGAINTRVVSRSNALHSQWQESYGSDFTYQEYLKFDPPLAWLGAASITAGTLLFTSAMQQPLIRNLLQPLLPQPGSGPSEKTMNEGWFRCEILGLASDGRKVRGLICDQGDPGNRATVKFLCESALSLALNEDKLPGSRQRGGILTPATGLGEVLEERLRKAGMTIQVEEVAPDLS